MLYNYIYYTHTACIYNALKCSLLSYHTRQVEFIMFYYTCVRCFLACLARALLFFTAVRSNGYKGFDSRSKFKREREENLAIYENANQKKLLKFAEN